MKRARLHNNIRESLSRFSSEIEISNQNSQFDINIHSEYLLRELLNKVFDYDLTNANQISKNYPAVDLIDEENRVSFQITSTLSKEKIKETIRRFVENNLYKKFDDLYILFLSTQKISIKLEGIESLTTGKLNFTSKNLLNLSKLSDKIQSLPLAKIEEIEEMLTEEFREEKVNFRIKTYSVNSKIVEPYVVNLVPIEFPEILNIGDINFDKSEVRKSIKKKRKISDRDIVKQAINNISPDIYCEDWEISSDKIITFRDLYTDPCLSKLVDQGTITPMGIKEYCLNESQEKTFKSLVNFVFRERAKSVLFEWFQKDKIYRIKSPKLPKEVTVTWTMEKKPQPRAVIKEVWNEEKTHIVCFRHLAFFLNVYHFDDKWYLSFKPTYSFTSNGFRKSRFSKYYASGKKKEDDNESVYHDFRFILWNLRKLDETLFDSSFPYKFKIGKIIKLESAYAIDDKKWNPKISKKSNLNIINLFPE